MKNLWVKWLTLSKKLVNIPANVILTVFYVIFILPFSIILKVFFKHVLLGHGYYQNYESFWVKKRKIEQDLSWAKQQ